MKKNTVILIYILLFAPCLVFSQKLSKEDESKIKTSATDFVKGYYEALSQLKDTVNQTAKVVESGSADVGDGTSVVTFQEVFLNRYFDSYDIYVANDIYPYAKNNPTGEDKTIPMDIYMLRLRENYKEGVTYKFINATVGEIRYNETASQPYYFAKAEVEYSLKGKYRDGNLYEVTQKLDFYLKISDGYTEKLDKVRLFGIDWARGMSDDKKNLSKAEEVALGVRAFYCEQYDLAYSILNQQTELGKKDDKDSQKIKKDPSATFALAWMHFRGYGGAEQSDEETIKYLEYAGKQDHVLALYNLGQIYYFGYGAEEDEKKALDYYEKAGRKGMAEGYYYMGKIYEEGKQLEADKKKAIKWYEKAAKEGYQLAKDKLKELGEK